MANYMEQCSHEKGHFVILTLLWIMMRYRSEYHIPYGLRYNLFFFVKNVSKRKKLGAKKRVIEETIR
jgi:hypothetical protein